MLIDDFGELPWWPERARGFRKGDPGMVWAGILVGPRLTYGIGGFTQTLRNVSVDQDGGWTHGNEGKGGEEEEESG